MKNNEIEIQGIKAVVGLGNPGPKYQFTRHNIGFLITEKLAEQYGGSFKEIGDMNVAQINCNGKPLLIVQPQTFMNSSGKAIAFLAKKGIKPEEMLVVHDELELPFGQMKFKMGGSAKGHNGLRSLMSFSSVDFARLRFGIGRPERKEDVPDYVLQNFPQPRAQLEQEIDNAVAMIVEQI